MLRPWLGHTQDPAPHLLLVPSVSLLIARQTEGQTDQKCRQTDRQKLGSVCVEDRSQPVGGLQPSRISEEQQHRLQLAEDCMIPTCVDKLECSTRNEILRRFPCQLCWAVIFGLGLLTVDCLPITDETLQTLNQSFIRLKT